MRAYKRHGGKRWRNEQVGKVAAVLAFSGAKDINEVGYGHVVSFYRQLRVDGKSHKTQMAYFYALAAAYREVGRTKEPPRPLKAI